MELSKEEKILLNKLEENKDTYVRLNCVQVDVLVSIISKLQKENELLKEQKEYVINEYGETIEKQSKVIDEMAKYIDNLEDCLSELGELEQCVVLYNTKSIKECINNHNCKECIKQYFYRMVERK